MNQQDLSPISVLAIAALMTGAWIVVYRRSKLYKLMAANPFTQIDRQAEWFEWSRLQVGLFDFLFFYIIAIDNQFLHIVFPGIYRLMYRPGKSSIPLSNLRQAQVSGVSEFHSVLKDSKSGITFILLGKPGRALHVKLNRAADFNDISDRTSA